MNRFMLDTDLSIYVINRRPRQAQTARRSAPSTPASGSPRFGW